MADPVTEQSVGTGYFEKGKAPETGDKLKENEQNLQPFLDGLKDVNTRDRLNFFARSLEWDNQNQQGKTSGDTYQAEAAKNALRFGGVLPSENAKDPLKKHILLTDTYLERDPKQPSKLVYTADITGNETAGEALGWAEILPANVKVIKVYNEAGNVESERAFRAYNPKVNPREIAYYDEKTYQETGKLKKVAFDHGWKVEILSTGSFKDPDVQRMELAEKIHCQEASQNLEAAHQSRPLANQSRMSESTRRPEIPKEKIIIAGTPYEKVDRTFWEGIVGENSKHINTQDPVDKNKSFLFLGKKFACNDLIKPYLVEVEARLNQAGIKFNPENIGAFNKRNIKDAQGQDTGRKSLHSWGVALDIDPEKNPRYEKSGNIPEAVLAIFRSVGFNCGADWSQKNLDEMHMEFGINPAKSRDLLQSEDAQRCAKAVFGDELKGERLPDEDINTRRARSFDEAVQRLGENPQFLARVDEIARKIGCQREDLLQIMWKESRLDRRAVNKISGASGLIQFMPKTAQAYGTTVEAIRKMSAMEQLDYVEKYFSRFGKINNYPDLYLAVFYPAALGKGEDFILGSERSDAYAKKVERQNPGIDKDGDGYISVADFRKYAGGSPSKKDV